MAGFLSGRLGLLPKSLLSFSPTVPLKPSPGTLLFHRFKHCFTRNESENLLCETVKVEDVMNKVGERPFYLYSNPQITRNFEAVKKVLKDLNAMIGFDIKANNNLHILKHLSSLGSGAAAVSGNELRLALQAGFSPSKIIFNGSGNRFEDLVLAARKGVLINIDNACDMEDIILAAKFSQKKVNILLCVNHLDPLASTNENSKFSHKDKKLQWLCCEDAKVWTKKKKKKKKLQWFVEAARAHSHELNLVGIHCHLGRTIGTSDIFRDALSEMVKFVDEIKAFGFEIKYLNIKGGMQIGSLSTGDVLTHLKHLIGTVRKEDLPKKVTLIIEPGRCLVENACCFVNRVIQVKSEDDKNIIVVDRDAEEVLHCSRVSDQVIELENHESGANDLTFDVVVPNCQSDKLLVKGIELPTNCQSEKLLVKGIELPTPVKGAGLVVFNTGDYSMRNASSTYDLKTSPLEYWVEKNGSVMQIRREESLEDHMSVYQVHTDKLGNMNSEELIKRNKNAEDVEDTTKSFSTDENEMNQVLRKIKSDAEALVKKQREMEVDLKALTRFISTDEMHLVLRKIKSDAEALVEKQCKRETNVEALGLIFSASILLCFIFFSL